MKTSEKIDLIVPALLKVKSKIQAVIKDSNNPFFKSKYADLNAHLDTVEPLLAENDLLLLQPTTVSSVNGIGTNVVETVLVHKSGQYISGELAVTMSGLDAQKLGAAVTYFRRYTLGSLLGMKAEDDDGNKASDKVNPAQKANSPVVQGAGGTLQTQALIGGAVNPNAQQAKPSFRKPAAKPTTVARPTNAAATSTEDI